ncbi:MULTISPECIES: twin-arginine translocation signal domain-containing protein [Actinomadura]|uniref:Twin-arginine translocation signal domain-containing protein n=1 Tax=Actinomadura geliboluensis TaxID=882440 RepID=A0A5S4GQ08_9ACTN|nr:twin-arginine translocation signal domain-containing protein [Actinomadura geliboluensis]TMR34957.1 twin-arginine translocation signal domain-containing protein [Actinomadura geliboluensis]
MTTTTEHRPRGDAGGRAGGRAGRATGRWARRGFLGALGAGGLTAASAVFGRSEPAYAICKQNCCNLAVCPNVSMTTCRNNMDYLWGCAMSAYLHCSCCEAYYSGKQHSAFECRYS